MGVRDARIESLAASQYGVFAVWQLEGIGVSPRAVPARDRDGRLRRLFRGVYATGPYLSVRGQWMAAALACGPEGAVSHRAAGALWETIDWRGGPVDVTVPAIGRRSRHRLRIHAGRTLLSRDRTRIDGIPVTSLGRTLLDLGAILPPLELQRAYEAAERAQVLDRRAITDLLARSNGHRGSGPLTALLDYDPTAAANALSELERLFLDLLRAHEVSLPLTNVLVDGYLVDAFWPDANLVVELDGYEFHNDRKAFEADRRKLAELRRSGREAIALTHRQVVGEPDWVVDTVTALLRLGFAAACRS